MFPKLAHISCTMISLADKTSFRTYPRVSACDVSTLSVGALSVLVMLYSGVEMSFETFNVLVILKIYVRFSMETDSLPLGSEVDVKKKINTFKYFFVVVLLYRLSSRSFKPLVSAELEIHCIKEASSFVSTTLEKKVSLERIEIHYPGG